MKKLIQLKNINDKQLDPVNLNYETRISKNEEQIATNETSIENLNGTVLYENESNTTDTVTLNDSASNYSYLEIFYKDCDSYRNSVKVYNPNNKIFICLSCYISSDTNRFYIKGSTHKINKTSISKIEFSELCLSQNVTNYNNQSHNITRVIGYK